MDDSEELELISLPTSPVDDSGSDEGEDTPLQEISTTGELLNIHLKDESSDVCVCRVERDAALRPTLEAYAKLKGLDMDKIEFVVGGCLIRPSWTAQSVSDVLSMRLVSLQSADGVAGGARRWRCRPG